MQLGRLPMFFKNFVNAEKAIKDIKQLNIQCIKTVRILSLIAIQEKISLLLYTHFLRVSLYRKGFFRNVHSHYTGLLQNMYVVNSQHTPKWFVPVTISKPSFVTHRLFSPRLSPALLTRTESRWKFSLNFETKFRTELKSARSSCIEKKENIKRNTHCSVMYSHCNYLLSRFYRIFDLTAIDTRLMSN